MQFSTVPALMDHGGFRYGPDKCFPSRPPCPVFSDAPGRIGGAIRAVGHPARARSMFPFEKPGEPPAKRNEFMGPLDESHARFGPGDDGVRRL